MALCGVCEPAPRSRLPRRFACTQPYRVFLGTPSSLAALAYPISLASFTACTLYSWSYCLFPAILSTLLILLIISQILENEVSTFFIPHHKFKHCFFRRNRRDSTSLLHTQSGNCISQNSTLSDLFPFHLFYGLVYRKNTA